MAKKMYIGIDNVARKGKKAYIGVEALPSGYTPVDYLQSDGNQYINTGFNPNQNTRVVCDFQMVKTGVGQSIFGSFAFDSNYAVIGAFLLQLPVENQFVSWCGAGDSQAKAFVASSISATGRYLCDKDKTLCKLTEGNVVDHLTQTFSSSYPIYLFAGNLMNSVFEPASVRIWSVKIYDNGTLVREFVPCKNASGVAGMYDKVFGKFYANVGSGSFTVGSSTASSVARRIKKGYIGIGGVARPFFTGGGLDYYGTITPLSVARSELAATTVGNYALFGGGRNATSKIKATDAYDTSFTRTAADDLSQVRYGLAATTIEQYALFGGGQASSSYSKVDTYNMSLTKGTAANLSTAVHSLAATTVLHYALFGGGNSGGAYVVKVNAYDASLTRSSPTNLNYGRHGLAATTVGGYALFGGGLGTSDSAVDAYDTALTKSLVTNLSVGRNSLAATTVGGYALFGGGENAGYEPYGTVEAYDKSLTRTTVASLSVARTKLTATTVGDFALFGGGSISSGTYYGTVDVYDKSLTRTTTTDLSVPRQLVVATTIGNYALFGGGRDGGNYYSTVDAYTVA